MPDMDASVAYRILADTSQVIDDCLVARLVRFPSAESTRGLMVETALEIPQEVRFESMFRVLKETDYPCNDVSWPIMSRRMLDTLLSIGDFKRREIPVRMFDDLVLKDEDRIDASGSVRPEVVDDRFVAVQLLEHLQDAFDFEQSDYMPSRISPKFVSKVKKLVIKTPPADLPPLFRLAACRRYLFVSVTARQALNEAAIAGPVFQPLDRLVS